MPSFSTSLVMNKEAIFLPSKQIFPTGFHSSSVPRWVLRRGDDGILSSKSMKSQATRALANTNGSPTSKGSSGRQIIMVDPLEAKRLAAKQMERIQAKERFKRQRRIEAINGTWAMIGLTAGLVVEGKTGHGILAQLGVYWAALIGLFGR